MTWTGCEGGLGGSVCVCRRSVLLGEHRVTGKALQICHVVLRAGTMDTHLSLPWPVPVPVLLVVLLLKSLEDPKAALAPPDPVLARLVLLLNSLETVSGLLLS